VRMKNSSQVLILDYPGLTKIVSGGQVGADIGALHAARALSIKTGGWAPRGWRTALGPNPGLAEFGLQEHFRTEYKFRTEKNVEDSDGTLIVASDVSSPGTSLTISSCYKLKKPFYILRPSEISTESVDAVVSWIKSYCICVLNVAGNRDRMLLGVHYNAALKAVSGIITRLSSE